VLRFALLRATGSICQAQNCAHLKSVWIIVSFAIFCRSQVSRSSWGRPKTTSTWAVPMGILRTSSQLFALSLLQISIQFNAFLFRFDLFRWTCVILLLTKMWYMLSFSLFNIFTMQDISPALKTRDIVPLARLHCSFLDILLLSKTYNRCHSNHKLSQAFNTMRWLFCPDSIVKLYNGTIKHSYIAAKTKGERDSLRTAADV